MIQVKREVSVTVQTAKGPVEVIAPEVYGLWAVTREIDYWSNAPTTERGRWKVTHVPSGQSATNGATLTKKNARRLARLLVREAMGRKWWTATPHPRHINELRPTVLAFLEDL